MSKCGAVILAAGLSTRMRENKVLLPWRDGRPIVAHVAAKFADAGIGPVIVVTGRDAADARSAVAELPVRCVHNPDFASGEMLSSVKAGLSALPGDLSAAFIQPADMPCVPQLVIGELVARHEAGWNVAPQYEGQRGHPVLLDRAYWQAMLELPADAKPRAVLRGARLRLVDVSDSGVLLDVDTREAYERALGRE
ncbi:MAG: nucleotidyltransferase family protein [Anaerolineae bacterium]|nr:nucleotidyltransferase family protein [Anaerolineae bacterium]